MARRVETQLPFEFAGLPSPTLETLPGILAEFKIFLLTVVLVDISA